MTQSMWDFYKVSPEPVRQACIAEWQAWLAEVEASSEWRRLGNDLRSLEPPKHFSARLELYLHHHFKSQGFRVEFHPGLKDSTDRPDLLVHHERGAFYLEATIRHDERSFAEQETFADLLRTELAYICSPHQVFVDISQPCPETTFLSEIKDFLEQQLLSFNEGGEVEKEVVWRKSVHLTSYKLLFSLHRRSGACQPLAVSPIWGGVSRISGCLYDSVDSKACKYGSLGLPFVIAVWGLSSPDQFAEKETLYGQVAAVWSRDHHGNMVDNSFRSFRRRDGIFTLIEEGEFKNRKVSAVVFYQHWLANTDHQHVLRLYHNPNALNPLPQEIFDGVSQY